MRFMPVLATAWLTVLTGMLLSTVIVYRPSGRAPATGNPQFTAPLFEDTDTRNRPVRASIVSGQEALIRRAARSG